MKHLILLLALVLQLSAELTNATLDGVTNATINGKLDDDAAATRTALGLGTAATAASTAFVPSAAATSGLLSQTILIHDACGGANATLADNATRACVPGPGTMTAGEIRNQSVCRYENGELILASMPSTTNANIVVWDAQTPAAGLTWIVRLVPGVVRGQACNLTVGFSHSYTVGDGKRGLIQIKTETTHERIDVLASRMNSYSGSVTPPTAHLPSNNTDTTLFPSLYGGGVTGEEVAVAIHYKTLTHQQYYMQGGKFASLGAVLGSDVWFMVDQTYGDMTSVGTIYPYVGFQGPGTHRVRDVQLLTSWTPNENKMVAWDQDREHKGVHIPSLAKDPATGLVVAGWHKGWSQFGATAYNDLRAAVRLADGTWTEPQTIVADPAGADAVTFGHISVVKNEIWAIYAARTLTGAESFDGGVLTRRALTVNATTGVITVGSAVTLTGINTGGQDQSFGNVIETDTGRLILPYQNNLLSPRRQLFAYSDDNGTNWTVVDPFSGGLPDSHTYMAEGCLTNEASGAIACYMRAGVKAYYTRSTNNGVSWSNPVGRKDFPMVTADGTRLSSYPLADDEALLIGSDHGTKRRNVTLWKVNNVGQVVWKRFIGDLNDDQSALSEYSMLQYPVCLLDGDDFIMLYSHQHGADGNTNLSMSIRASVHFNPLKTAAPAFAKEAFRKDPVTAPRLQRTVFELVYSTAPVPDLSRGNLFALTLTASTAVLGVPLNPLPWEEITLVFVQGGAGSFTATFNAIFEFGGITPTWRTAVSATNTLKAYYNPLTAKWVVTSWN